MIRDMKKDEMIKALESIADSMKARLAESEQMWNDGTSHAVIIGYLQGTIGIAEESIQSIIKK